ncbi:hypothetical protein BJX76DRAFT_354530 [Aspergillus varians]
MNEEYTTGWISSHDYDQLNLVSPLMDGHGKPHYKHLQDQNTYRIGTMNKHNVVAMCLPCDVPSSAATERVVKDTLSSFLATRLFILITTSSSITCLAYQELEYSLCNEYTSGYKHITRLTKQAYDATDHRQTPDVTLPRIYVTRHTPSILLVNRQITTEALSVLYNTELTLHGTPATYFVFRQMDIAEFISETLLQRMRNVVLRLAEPEKLFVLALLDIWGVRNELRRLVVYMPVDKLGYTGGGDRRNWDVVETRLRTFALVEDIPLKIRVVDDPLKNGKYYRRYLDTLYADLEVSRPTLLREENHDRATSIQSPPTLTGEDFEYVAAKCFFTLPGEKLQNKLLRTYIPHILVGLVVMITSEDKLSHIDLLLSYPFIFSDIAFIKHSSGSKIQ